MVSRCTAIGLFAVAAFLAAALPAAAVEPPMSTPPTPGLVNPFGPAWDPTRPPPVDPVDEGDGIVSAAVVAAGPARLRAEGASEDDTRVPLFGVVLDVEIAPGSVTPVLSADSVYGTGADGPDLPLVMACTPTMEDAAGVWQGAGASTAAWNVGIGDRTWFCGGRTARLAVRVGPGGIRLRSPAGSAWKGPLVLLFDGSSGDRPGRVVLPGAAADIAPEKAADAPN